LTAAETVRLENENLESNVSGLKCKLTLAEEQLSSAQNELRGELEQALVRTDKLETHWNTAIAEKDKAISESKDLREKCLGQSKSIDALTQQITR